MRWFGWSAALLLLVWGAYTASPYWALADFSRAIAARDDKAILRRVNFRAVRLSLARQVVSDGLSATAGADSASSADKQILASTVAVAADPFIEQIVTPDGVRRLLAELNPRIVGEAPARADRPAWRRALKAAYDTVRTARWRGFRNVYFFLPPTSEDGAQIRVQLRLSRLTWRVVSVEVPPETRRHLVERVLRRYGPTRTE